VLDKLKEYQRTLRADDPGGPHDPEWKKIIDLSSKTLIENSKDIDIATRLVEALTKQHGFPGLRDGLQLLRRLNEEAWDRMLPVIEEDDDLDTRATRYSALDRDDGGMLFPMALRMITLVTGRVGPFNCFERDRVLKGKSSFSQEDLDQAVIATPLEVCQSNFEDLTQAMEEFLKLKAVLDEKLRSYSPSFSKLREALGECYTVAKGFYEQKAPPPEEGGGTDVGGQAADSGGSGRAPGSREACYRELARIADQLQALEPHSPIPYILKRAVEMGKMPFPQLIRALVNQDENALGNLRLWYGIHSDPEST
jgi:type VI secretion system protein ImpA